MTQDLTPRRDPPRWVGRYIGLEYLADGRSWRGIDCWGLCWLVYREILGIDVPSYEGHAIVDPDGLPELSAFISAECDRHWTEVACAPAPGDELVWTRPEQLGDIVISRTGAHHHHTSMLVARRTVLTIDHKTAVHLDAYDRDPMRRRVARVVRHRDLA